jgi:putative ATP-binding cassette transporter
MKVAHRRIWSYFVTLITPIFRSPLRWRATGFLGGLVGLLLIISGLNVLNSFVNRDFMTALEQRQATRFFYMALIYLGVFGLLTLVAVTYRFTEERLGLLWRGWLTDHFLARYLHDRAYYRLTGHAEIDNPDQRITEDVKAFTATTLSLLLIGMNSSIALISFSSVLWSITPWLLLAALGYATLGSLLIYLVGWRLVGLNTAQFKKEADFRYELVLVREHAEPVAMTRHEEALAERLRSRLGTLLENMRRIITVNRNLGYFTTGYNYLIQVIPILIVAPLYLRGEVEFGVVTQSAIAFGHVLAAFSLIINEFQRLSTFAAVIHRLGGLWEATDAPTVAAHPVDATSPEDKIVFDRLTLKSPDGKKLLVKDLTLEVPPRGRVLIHGANASGKSCLLRAIAGLHSAGTGRVVHPPVDHLMILPGMPYLTEGTLREQLAVPGRRVNDADALAALTRCGLEQLAERPGGLDTEADWPVILSPSEQQRLAFARLLLADPPFALLDESTSALDPEAAQTLYTVLSDTSAGYVTITHMPGLEEFHDSVLELHRDGTWELHNLSRAKEQTVAVGSQ